MPSLILKEEKRIPYAEYHRKQKERERTIKRRKYFREYSREYRRKSNGGTCLLLSPEEVIKRRKQFGESREGEGNPMYGKHQTEETKEKMRKDKVGEQNPSWIDGRSFEPYTSQFNKEIKELIRQRDNYQCQKCGMPECEGDRKLDIHHIDYNKKNCKSSNLISLCRRCNGKVNCNREYWEKYFRIKIKESEVILK